MKKFLFVICNLSFVISLLFPFPALAATLSLSPTTGTFGKSCSFAVDVLLDTQGVETDGTDIILLYDPQLLSAQSIITGKIYSDFPGNNIDNSSGKVSIFALAPADKGFTGKGSVASVNFTTSATASASVAKINFDFDSTNTTKTTDSNVMQKSDLKDVLNSVTSGIYTLDTTATGCKTALKTLAAPKGGATTTLPDSGVWEPTLAIGGLGMILILLGLLGLRKYRLSERC